MNVPKLRFKEFDGEWEEKEFGDLFEVKSGYAFKLKDYVSHGVSLINGESIQSDCIQTNNINFLPDNFLVQYKAFKLNTNDIVLGLNRPIIGGKLKIARVPEELNNSLLYQRAGKIIFKSKELCGSFFYTFLSKEIYKFAKKESVGSDQPFISTTKLNKWKFTYPINLLEQQKIGTLFEILNKKIQLQQQKIDLLQEQKKGYMQKIFAPRISQEDWEEVLLGDIVDINSGRDYKHLVKGNIPVYGTGGYMLSVNESLSEFDAVGIGRKGSIDKPQLLKAPFWTVDTLFYCIPKDEQNLDFIYLIFQNINWKKYDESTGVPSLSKATIKNIKVLKPNVEVQKLIGEFFKNLDEKIYLQNRKLEILQKQKQGFMQQMFI